MKTLRIGVSDSKFQCRVFSNEHGHLAKFFPCLLFPIFLLSCDRNSSQAEKDYIKTLEEKNKTLEEELQTLRGVNIDSTMQNTNKKAPTYFTIDSSEDEVISVMGEPTSYLKTAPEAHKFLYGISTVYFYKGKVISYDDLGGNLRVKVRKQLPQK